MKKFLAVLLILAALAMFAFNTADKVKVTCGPTVTTPLMVRGLDAAGGFGDLLHWWGQGHKTDKLTIAEHVWGMWGTLGTWKNNWKNHLRGVPEDSAATGIRVATKEQQDALLASCCPVSAPPPEQDPATPPPDEAEPFDPRVLSMSASGQRWTSEQLSIAATAIGIRKQRNLPPRADVVILATGFQESGIRNLNHGDRDSLGWLQQRAGWGSADQRRDPAYAAGKFFDALVKVNGWERMPVTRAAQAVQISAYPNAYAKWEDDARALAAAVGPRTGAEPSNPSQGGTSVDQLPNALETPAPANCPTLPANQGNQSGELGGTVSMVADLNPAGAGNFQGGVRDGQFWFVAKATTGNRATVVHRLDMSGRQVDEMRITGPSHPTGFGVRNGTVYVDIADQVMKVPYKGGATVDGLNAAETGWFGEIGLDPNADTAVIRNGNKYRLYDLRSQTPIGVQVKTAAGTRQGFGVSGRVLYVLSGATNQRASVETWSFTSGRQIATRDVTNVGFKPGERKGNREPEGMYGNVMGVKVFTGDKRRLRMFTINAAPTPADPGVRGVRKVTSYGKTYMVRVPNGAAGKAVSFALDQVGEPYVFGSHGPNSWDCSGLVAGAWSAAGGRVPAQTQAIARALAGSAVAKSSMQPGDLLWWRGNGRVGHVQMYLGDGLIVEAPRTGLKVRVTKMNRQPERVFRPINQGTAA